MSLSRELESDETITVALFLFIKKIMLMPSFTHWVSDGQLMTVTQSCEVTRSY